MELQSKSRIQVFDFFMSTGRHCQTQVVQRVGKWTLLRRGLASLLYLLALSQRCKRVLCNGKSGPGEQNVAQTKATPRVGSLQLGQANLSIYKAIKTFWTTDFCVLFLRVVLTNL